MGAAGRIEEARRAPRPAVPAHTPPVPDGASTETSPPATNDPTMSFVADDSSDVLAARLRTAFDLFELGESMRRAQLRREHPNATNDEIEALLIAWLHTRPGAERGDSWGRQISWPPARP